jgi:hypothetical protein
MRHDVERPPVASTPRKPASSHALADARLYRPGALLAGGILLLPPAVALVSAAVAVELTGRIPLWLPLILLLWLPLMAAAWLTMISVRTSPTGIAIARPWSRWSEIRWTLIDHVRRRGPRITIHSSDDRLARFYPFALQDGARLKRELLMRLPVHVLDARLRGEARELLGEPIGQRAQILVADPLQARPRRVWSVGLVALLIAATVGAGFTLALLPFPLALFPVILALVALALCAYALPICLQTVSLDDAGVTVKGAFGRHIGRIAWDDIQLVERTPRERMLRLRGAGRLRCAGPSLLGATQAEIFRAYLQTYCTERGALMIVRRWL